MRSSPTDCYHLTVVNDVALTVFTRPDCTYSDALMHELERDGVPFRQIDLEAYPQYVEEVERLTGGERVTPVMVEGEVVVGGYHGIG